MKQPGLGSPNTRKIQELSSTPNPWYFLKSIKVSPVQMGGVLRYKWEAHCGANRRCIQYYCGVSLSSRLGSQRGTALQMEGGGGVLRCKLEVYCQYFSDKLYGTVPKNDYWQYFLGTHTWHTLSFFFGGVFVSLVFFLLRKSLVFLSVFCLFFLLFWGFAG